MRILRTTVLTLALFLIASSASAQSLSIATGGTGGVYYPLGGGLADLISRHVAGVTAVAEVTQASAENVALISRGDSDIAFTLADTLYQAYTGTGTFEGRQLSNLRAIAAVYPNAIHIVTLEGSGITSIADLRGRRVSVGAPASGTEISAQLILAANGISYDDISEQRLNFNETANALRDGQIDAGFWSVGPPTSSILDLATTRSVVLIPLTEEEIAAVRELDPVFAAYIMRADMYPGQAADVLTLSTPNILVVSDEMDEETVYNILSAMFANIEELRAIHPAANDTTIEFTLESTPIPFHPGAIRYYEEQGYEIPDHLRGE